MAGAAAQLLDQLMGTARNAVPGDNVKELKLSDDEVCKYYLCGFCPSELFINTKAESSVGELEGGVWPSLVGQPPSLLRKRGSGQSCT